MLDNSSLQLSVRGQGAPLVLLHGFGFDKHIFATLCRYLERDFTCYTVDLPGFGLTPVMGWEQFIAALLPLLPSQFRLLGWSLGGLYATRLALENPTRVTHLLNVASSPKFIKADDWPGIEPPAFVKFNQDIASNSEKTLSTFLQLQGVDGGYLPRWTKEGLALGMENLLQWDLRLPLSSAEMKIGYTFGRLDSIVPIKTMQVMQKLYPKFHYAHFNKAAHVPFLSHRLAFVEYLKGFML